jgi:acetyltransferase-like isoleucine patch superfamily enzyme
MSGRFKQVVSSLLWPLAQLNVLFGIPVRRLWSYALLRSQLPGAPLSVVCEGPVELHGTRQVRLGENLYVYPAQYWETRESGQLTIGDGVVLSRGVHLVAYAGVTLGAGTMVGEYASIRDANHRRDQGDIRHSGHEAKPVVIGRQVWIGRGACVLSGVSIGDNAVVAANAVVTRDVPAGAVVAGVPARPIQRRAPSTQPTSHTQPMSEALS